MAGADWRLEGEWIKNCNCAFGCPCDFNAKPTQGECKGLLGMRITTGHFNATRLDGLSFFVISASVADSIQTGSLATASSANEKRDPQWSLFHWCGVR